MITKWTVANFKSIAKETPLSLAPLTILAGSNSSGKSTFLQSLLLISQTVAYKVSSRSVVLNGALARLGQFDDLKSHDSESDQITIGWECHPTGGAQTSFSESYRLRLPLTVYGRRIETLKEISCKLAFDASPGSTQRDLFQLQPQLFLFTMSLLARAEDKTDHRYELTISRSQAGSAKVGQAQINESYEAGRSSLEYDIALDDNSLGELKEDFITAEPVGCVLRHFLLERISIKVNMIEEIARQLFMALTEDSPRYYGRFSLTERDLVIPESVIRLLREKLGEEFSGLFDMQQPLFEDGLGFPIREWMERVRRLSLDNRRELRRVIAESGDLQKIIAEALRSDLKAGESEYRILPYRPPSDLMNASAYLNILFSNFVRYLGPLRDEPKPLYPLAAHADPTDVGLRGEMTAAVLNLHKGERIRYIPSSAFAKTSLDPTPIVRTLESAVTDWLKYLDVADSARSVDKGKLGHELKVTSAEGGPEYDLTHVGVGVSQVLPILVMSLLADRDTTLIIEQPELHLHPKVQTRLADFFLSISLADKQCLIETHSEYLINRLRYRAAAEGDANRVTDNLKIYFVEKEAGASAFREVKVNEYGAILDWPEGFFDQSQFEAESILRAAAAKRKTRGGK